MGSMRLGIQAAEKDKKKTVFKAALARMQEARAKKGHVDTHRIAMPANFHGKIDEYNNVVLHGDSDSEDLSEEQPPGEESSSEESPGEDSSSDESSDAPTATSKATASAKSVTSKKFTTAKAKDVNAVRTSKATPAPKSELGVAKTKQDKQAPNPRKRFRDESAEEGSTRRPKARKLGPGRTRAKSTPLVDGEAQVNRKRIRKTASTKRITKPAKSRAKKTQVEPTPPPVPTGPPVPLAKQLDQIPPFDGNKKGDFVGFRLIRGEKVAIYKAVETRQMYHQRMRKEVTEKFQREKREWEAFVKLQEEEGLAEEQIKAAESNKAAEKTGTAEVKKATEVKKTAGVSRSRRTAPARSHPAREGMSSTGPRRNNSPRSHPARDGMSSTRPSRHSSRSKRQHDIWVPEGTDRTQAGVRRRYREDGHRP